MFSFLLFSESNLFVEQKVFSPFVGTAKAFAISSLDLNVELDYKNSKFKFLGGSHYTSFFFNRFKLKHKLNYFSLQDKLFFTEFRFGLFDSDILNLQFPIKNTLLVENSRLNRFYNTGVSVFFDDELLKADIDFLWAKPQFSMNDFSSFFGKPVFDDFFLLRTNFSVKERYKVSPSYFHVKAMLKNDLSVPFVFLDAAFIENSYSVFFSPIENLNLSAKLAIIHGSGTLKFHLTNENQHYFLFPYIFYNRNILFNTLIIKSEFKSVYKKNNMRISFSGTLYSLANFSGSDFMHSKKKTNILYNGEEAKSYSKIKSINNKHFLIFNTDFSYEFNPATKLFIGKTIPIPILNSENTSESSSSQGASLFSDFKFNSFRNIDFLLSGLSIKLLIKY